MQDIHKVYLDTNVIILGPESNENHKLVEMSKMGIIKLFVSEKVTMERRARSFKQSEIIDKIIRQEKILGEEKFFKLFNEAIKEREKLKKLEKDEVKFWMQVRPENVKSTFRGLTWLGLLGADFIKLFDTKSERVLLAELLTTHNIKDADAFHIMEAHSAEMDYFLTWDDKLIKKTKRISWLKPKVLTPKIFIEKISSSE
ncbi:MAG: hypothetical protein ACOC5T_00570 [Elusimicrobiota bacterium]